MKQNRTYEIVAQTKIKLTEENIEDIIVGALEGGIGYWACLDNTGEAYESAPDDEPVSITCAKELLAGRLVRFEDAENDDEYVLSLNEFLYGFKKWFEEGGDWYGAVQTNGGVDCGMIDSGRADAIIQYSLFGCIMFS